MMGSTRFPVLPPLIGREADLIAIHDHLHRTRLVSVIGPGGCGKTHLALHLAREMEHDFPDGIWYVMLETIDDPALVTAAILATLHVMEQSDATIMRTLLATLRLKRTMLILDNCEHVLAACVPVVTMLIQHCPELRILATSREPLALAIEQQWQLKPLSLPPPQREITQTQGTEYGAIALFQQRAAAIAPHFVVSDVNIDAICRLCRRLDGLPLAIELAAMRLRHLTPDQMLACLDDGLDILGTGKRMVTARPLALEATIAWSYNLLAPSEQALLRRLAICAGDCDLDLVMVLGSACADAASTPLDLLSRLVETSLVQVEYHPGEARYYLLETIRQFGRQRLRQTGEETAAYHDYVRWSLAFAQHAEQGLRGGTQHRTIDLVEHNLDHLRAVMGWLLAHDDAEQTLVIAAALSQFWLARGAFTEGRHWLELGLAQLAAAKQSDTHARALIALGQIFARQGELLRAESCYQRAGDILQATGNRHDAALARQHRGMVAVWLGEFARARQLLEGSLRDLRDLGDGWGTALGLHRLGTLEFVVGAYDQALTWYHESLGLRDTLADRFGSADSLLNMGLIWYQRGDMTQATTYTRMSLLRYRELADSKKCADALINLADFARCAHDNIGAESYLIEALRCRQHAGDDIVVPYLITRLALIAAATEAHQRAARLGGVAERLYHALGATPENIAPEFLALQQSYMTASGTIGAAWAEGNALPAREALAFALANQTEGNTAAQEHLIKHAPKQRDADDMLKLYALGRSVIVHHNRALSGADLMYPKTRELIFYLIMHRERSREQIGLALWPDAPEEHSKRTLRVTLHRARHALGDVEWICYKDGMYSFNRTLGHWFDVASFEQLVDDAVNVQRSDQQQALALLESACALYQGDFLAGTPLSDWMTQRSYEIQRRYHEALLLRAQLHFTAGQFKQALETWLMLIARDPYHEPAHRGIITCYLRLDEPSHALQHFDRLTQQFAADLRLMPMPETRALLADLRQAL